MIKETKEASSRRDPLLGGSISETDAKTKLLATDLEGEYILNKTFLHLVEEYSLNL